MDNALSSSEIGLKIDEKDKELAKLLNDYHIIEQEKLLLQRDILERQVRRKDLEIALSKSSHSIKQINIERKLLRSFFWKARESGT